MDHVSQLERIRQLVRETFAGHGMGAEERWRETMLVRGGFYCGRIFATDQLEAVWFAEENAVKFYAADGRFLIAHSVEDSRQAVERRRAA